ncbi:MAG: bifunctional 2-C-methyl-D-erythritol 4-phosphate cytidylyltransferase/2-C-methyl-D-erythritol 2,4-cyclodiphosphate synthase [Minwuia sp.]|nr:bifunctional 2-C-methyl-D-erythritol 4-phosphate cytidylyltransferase/2-C-methyl-D-erythritol 2,4-cyclodiphosphate synthase [Minwuia sp.]
MQTAALIVAAGRGTRLGGELPKQYLLLDGEPVLRRTVSAFLAHPRIDQVLVVIGDGQQDLYDQALSGLDLLPPVVGGETRQLSVASGLAALASSAPTHVLIHDAARALIDDALISRVCDALKDSPAVLPALPVVDSLSRIDGDRVVGTQDREHLVRAQTPQGFDFAAITDAHGRMTGQAFSDDVAVARAAGMVVQVVAGTEDNFKITIADDLKRAESLLRQKGQKSVETRTGSGFDVHRLASEREMVLCGLPIPHPQGLAGHSDADVALHAITDAVLGAMAEGDIGDHFPPDDNRWKGVSSDIFLRYAASLLQLRAGRVVNIDLTIICEAPKIKPYRQAMRENVAAILGIPVHRISIKATTTERLGFTGRREGIAAQAIATVELPREPDTFEAS